MVITPRDTDVLCGIAPTVAAQHAGNQILQEQILAWAEEYHQAASSRQTKIRLGKRVVFTMHQQHGTRFLRRNTKDGSWMCMGPQAIRDKVSHSFRQACGGAATSTIMEQQQHKTSSKFREAILSAPFLLTDKDAAECQGTDFNLLQKLYESQKNILQRMNNGGAFAMA